MKKKHLQLFENPKYTNHIIPVPLFNSSINQKQHIELHIPKFRSKWATKLFFWTKNPVYKIELDELGSKVYQLCDEKKTIANIIEEIKNSSDSQIEQLEERALIFFRQLYELGYIDINFKDNY